MLRLRRPQTHLMLFALVATAGAVAAGASPELLGAIPALLLLAPLVAGRYLGERRLEQLATRLRRPATRRARSTSRSSGRRAPLRAASGGLLLAERLAGRAPPRIVATVR